MENTDALGSQVVYFAAFGWITMKCIEDIYVPPIQGEL